MKEILVDARGLSCPVPVVKTIKAIEELAGKGIVETHVDNEVAVNNILLMAKNKGLTAASKAEGRDHFVVRIESGEGVESPLTLDVHSMQCVPVKEDRTVVVLASELMGEGSDELGGILIKGFLYALTQLDKKPQTVILYNSGVKLAVGGSGLDHLKQLEEEGVEILSCGTCLDFFGIKDELAVGSISNMYSIVEKLSEATKIIKP